MITQTNFNNDDETVSNDTRLCGDVRKLYGSPSQEVSDNSPNSLNSEKGNTSSNVFGNLKIAKLDEKIAKLDEKIAKLDEEIEDYIAEQIQNWFDYKKSTTDDVETIKQIFNKLPSAVKKEIRFGNFLKYMNDLLNGNFTYVFPKKLIALRLLWKKIQSIEFSEDEKYIQSYLKQFIIDYVKKNNLQLRGKVASWDLFGFRTECHHKSELSTLLLKTPPKDCKNVFKVPLRLYKLLHQKGLIGCSGEDFHMDLKKRDPKEENTIGFQPIQLINDNGEILINLRLSSSVGKSKLFHQLLMMRENKNCPIKPFIIEKILSQDFSKNLLHESKPSKYDSMVRFFFKTSQKGFSCRRMMEILIFLDQRGIACFPFIPLKEQRRSFNIIKFHLAWKVRSKSTLLQLMVSFYQMMFSKENKNYLGWRSHLFKLKKSSNQKLLDKITLNILYLVARLTPINAVYSDTQFNVGGEKHQLVNPYESGFDMCFKTSGVVQIPIDSIARSFFNDFLQEIISCMSNDDKRKRGLGNDMYRFLLTDSSVMVFRNPQYDLSLKKIPHTMGQVIEGLKDLFSPLHYLINLSYLDRKTIKIINSVVYYMSGGEIHQSEFEWAVITREGNNFVFTMGEEVKVFTNNRIMIYGDCEMTFQGRTLPLPPQTHIVFPLAYFSKGYMNKKDVLESFRRVWRIFFPSNLNEEESDTRKLVLKVLKKKNPNYNPGKFFDWLSSFTFDGRKNDGGDSFSYCFIIKELVARFLNRITPEESKRWFNDLPKTFRKKKPSEKIDLVLKKRGLRWIELYFLKNEGQTSLNAELIRWLEESLFTPHNEWKILVEYFSLSYSCTMKTSKVERIEKVKPSWTPPFRLDEKNISSYFGRSHEGKSLKEFFKNKFKSLYTLLRMLCTFSHELGKFSKESVREITISYLKSQCPDVDIVETEKLLESDENILSTSISSAYAILGIDLKDLKRHTDEKSVKLQVKPHGSNSEFFRLKKKFDTITKCLDQVGRVISNILKGCSKFYFHKRQDLQSCIRRLGCALPNSDASYLIKDLKDGKDFNLFDPNLNLMMMITAFMNIFVFPLERISNFEYLNDDLYINEDFLNGQIEKIFTSLYESSQIYFNMMKNGDQKFSLTHVDFPKFYPDLNKLNGECSICRYYDDTPVNEIIGIISKINHSHIYKMISDKDEMSKRKREAINGFYQTITLIQNEDEDESKQFYLKDYTTLIINLLLILSKIDRRSIRNLPKEILSFLSFFVSDDYRMEFMDEEEKYWKRQLDKLKRKGKELENELNSISRIKYDPKTLPSLANQIRELKVALLPELYSNPSVNRFMNSDKGLELQNIISLIESMHSLLPKKFLSILKRTNKFPKKSPFTPRRKYILDEVYLKYLEALREREEEHKEDAKEKLRELKEEVESFFSNLASKFMDNGKHVTSYILEELISTHNKEPTEKVKPLIEFLGEEKFREYQREYQKMISEKKEAQEDLKEAKTLLAFVQEKNKPASKDGSLEERMRYRQDKLDYLKYKSYLLYLKELKVKLMLGSDLQPILEARFWRYLNPDEFKNLNAKRSLTKLKGLMNEYDKHHNIYEKYMSSDGVKNDIKENYRRIAEVEKKIIALNQRKSFLESIGCDSGVLKSVFRYLFKNIKPSKIRESFVASCNSHDSYDIPSKYLFIKIDLDSILNRMFSGYLSFHYCKRLMTLSEFLCNYEENYSKISSMCDSKSHETTSRDDDADSGWITVTRK